MTDIEIEYISIMHDMLSWRNRWADYSLTTASEETYRQFLRAFRVFKCGDIQFRRIGPDFDSGYVVPESAVFPGATAVSIGVGSADGIGFDLELGKNGVNVFQFDHIISDYRPNHDSITFTPLGIGWSNTGKIRTLSGLLQSRQIFEEIDILKIDVEGDEWCSLYSVDEVTLSRMRCIVIELHWLRHSKYEQIARFLLKVMLKLQRSHVIVRLHPNNIKMPFVHHGVEFPNVLEVVLVRKNAGGRFEPNTNEKVTDALDFSSDPQRPEFDMINPWFI